VSGSGPLNICMVTTFYPPYHRGGDGVFVYRLSEALSERGHRVDVVHSVDAYRLQRPAEPALTFSHHPRITRYPLESPRPLLSALAAHQLGRPGFYASRLMRLFEERRYDVIHYHNVSLLGGPAVLRLGQAIKLYTTHEYWLICPTHVLFAFNRKACTRRRCLACTLSYGRPPQGWRYSGALARSLAHVDALLVPSQFAIEQHSAIGVDRPMIHLPHFVGEVAPARAPGGPPAEPFFLYAGRLEKLKGVQDLIELFRDYRAARLLIAGDGTYRRHLQDQSRGLDHVRFLGPLHPSALIELYRSALAVLVPSLCYETFGLTAAEALAQGTPAIVRRIGALPEIVDSSGAGFTFESLRQCREALERIRLDPGLRASLGERGRAAAERWWSAEAHLKRYLQIIEDRLARGSSGRQGALGALGSLGEPAAKTDSVRGY